MPRLVALGLAAVLVGSAEAQTAPPPAVLVGRVLDAATGGGLPGVNVYLNRTLRGTATDAAGTFRLEGVEPGLYEVVASFVGYAPATRTVTVAPGAEQPVSFALSPLTGRLGGVTVTGDRSAWLRQLARFERAFLGEGPNARDTEILNPEVLEFEERDGALRATAAAPLRVVNRALGYRVEYDLAAFAAAGGAVEVRGHGLFTPLDPADGGERRRWETARERAYAGSFQHFVHALAAGRTRGPFRVYLANQRHRLTPTVARGADRLTEVRAAGQVFQVGPDGRTASLSAGNALLLRVDYEDEEDRAYVLTQPGRDRPGLQVSWVEMPAGVARLDVLGGQAFDPYPVEVSGYWGWEERISNWLPREYRPD